MCYKYHMGKIEQIEKAIEELSVQERTRLSEWLQELQERAFDDAIERDLKAGRLDKLIAEARAEMEAGEGEEF